MIEHSHLINHLAHPAYVKISVQTLEFYCYLQVQGLCCAKFTANESSPARAIDKVQIHTTRPEAAVSLSRRTRKHLVTVR